MPILKLRKHQANFSDEDILINPSDYNGLKLNDVVELKPPKRANASQRILLQVRKWPETNQSYPNSVSIKESVANAHLQLYADVLVNIVDKKDVLVDSIEICFGNAYLARSYMWGIRNHLNNRCVYQHQKLDYLHIRSQVCEIWAQGNKVSSGYVDEDTKIVFRSASSMVYLFIQMSSEMWDYDINGDLYCEKAINGFLTDLFDTWRENDCSHDITIILFSRTFYDADSIEEFPQEMRECLQVDYKNRFYEDCYRVAFQNDRFDLHDWNAKLITLKSLFNQYQKEVIDRHKEKYNTRIPRAHNSSAAQGNFLEVLNMSLNVFEKHYFDRSFDRTGQLSVVVSPGVGVFEVDFEMTNLTKQRIIDNGIGSDLVCLGEQPLHTVPLLKFNSKSSQFDDALSACDVYNMPHWINLSFYSCPSQTYYSNFMPRIKLPTLSNSKLRNDSSRATIVESNPMMSKPRNDSANLLIEDSPSRQHQRHIRNGPADPQFLRYPSMPDLVDYDEYDAQVFKPNSIATYHCQQQQKSSYHESILNEIDLNTNIISDEERFMDRNNRNKSSNIIRRSSDLKNYQEYSCNIRRQISENLPIGQSRDLPHQSTFSRMSLVDNYLSGIQIRPESADDLSVRGYNVQSSRLNRSLARPKALINPFDPSHMTIKLTPNRRRWTHVFPQGPSGTFIQQHHYQPISQKSTAPYLSDISTIHENEVFHAQKSGVNFNSFRRGDIGGRCEPNKQLRQINSQIGTLNNKTSGLKSTSSTSPRQSGHGKSGLVSNDTIRFAWCASGEQEWTPAITTGVDWKSLTMPACLPLTTDFFPSQTSLQNDYVIGEYTIDSSCIHPSYTLIEVYRELVCQRLQKGFQIILLHRQSSSSSQKAHTANNSTTLQSKQLRHSSSRLSSMSSSSSSGDNNDVERTEYTLSIGRIFHKLVLNSDTITVTQYRPRHPYPTIKINYCYRFRAPFHDTYIQSFVHFKSEELENYSWNYLDNYICARGESFELRSNLKFWRFRILILPSKSSLRKLAHASSPKDSNVFNYNECAKADPQQSALPARHDIYHFDFSDAERDALMESFMKLLEIINKTRRASTCRTSTGSSTAFSSSSSAVSAAGPSSQQQSSSSQPSSLTGAAAAALKQQPHRQQSITSSPTRLNVRISTGREKSVKSPHCSTSSQNNPSTPQLQQNSSSSSSCSSSLCLNGESSEQLRFESINMDIDSALRDARRAEWVHVQYHCFYDIYQAFELVIKWMVASGAGIAEMVQGWSRKVGSSSVHIVPIPWEPFAMPHSGKADPLRCPIGIQLHLTCLANFALLDDNQVINLQERILRRFGFVRFHDLISTEPLERQYVHMSGFAFVALPNLVSPNHQCADGGASVQSITQAGGQSPNSRTSNSTVSSPGVDLSNVQPILLSKSVSSPSGEPTKSTSIARINSASSKKDSTESDAGSGQTMIAKSRPKQLVQQETVSSPHEEYITRHIGGARQNKAHRVSGEHEQIEFIWSWNYMLTKRWRSSSTQDEGYAVSLMQDFKDFCQNGGNRLVEFWQQIKATNEPL